MRRMLLLLGLLLLAAAGPAPDEMPDSATSSEAWIWQQVQAGNDADFNQRCGTGRLDPQAADDPRWAAACRSVNPANLRALLSRPGLADTAPHGVRLRGARIGGTLNLDDMHLTAAEFTLIDSLLVGDLILTEAHLEGSLDVNGSVVTGAMKADSVHVDRAILIRHKAKIGKDIGLDSAVIGDFLSLEGATLAGGMDATSIQIGGYLEMTDGEVAGDVLLLLAKIQKSLVISDMKFTGGHDLNASMAQVGPIIILKTDFSGDVTLSGETIAGSLVLVDVTFASGKQVNLAGSEIGTMMGLQNVDFGGKLLLDSANVRETMSMTKVKFSAEEPVTANNLRVGNILQFQTPTEFPGGVSFDNALIGRHLNMQGARVGTGKTFSAVDMQIGGNFVLEKAEFGGDVLLFGSDVHGQLDLAKTKFAPASTLTLERLHVGQDVFFRDASVVKPINAIGLVAASLDLRGTTLGGLDLSGALIDGDLRLGPSYGNGQEAWTKWRAPDGPQPVVVLRNAKVGNLQDDENSWDGAELVLQDFNYAHLGGLGGVNRQDMRYRSVETWRKWLALDPVYSPQPYTQLASVLVAGGNSDTAADIRFIGRDRDRTERLRNCRWPHSPIPPATAPQRPCDLGGWIGLSILQATIGYGIGQYSFRALWWALALTVLGTIVLTFAPGVRARRQSGDPGGREKPLLWCFGATLNHVLPVVTLSPEFTDFFDDPKGDRLYAWQKVVFALLALCGWALSFFVVAAISGLTQN